MAISEEANLELFRTMEDMDQGKEESISALITTLRCLVSVVICVQYFMPA